MIKEVSVIKAFDDYRKAMNYTKTILEDVVLLTLHGENGEKLHGPISKINIQEILDLFPELPKPAQREWVGITNEEIDKMHYQIKARGMGAYKTEDIYRAIEAKLKEKNNG